ncbi:DNA mismatch repair protein [Microbacterium sp.]|uniref:DNA mismatch repair protein n=1 Tax=Microbacterium sp. TaxID=51671 RepID=UPI0039E6B714
MTTITDIPTPLVRGVTLLPVSARRWRVLDTRGRVLGHLRTEAVAAGIRYHAERFEVGAARMRGLGSFWSAREAVDCLRYLR